MLKLFTFVSVLMSESNFDVNAVKMFIYYLKYHFLSGYMTRKVPHDPSIHTVRNFYSLSGIDDFFS